MKNTMLIVGIVGGIILLLCCCCTAGVYYITTTEEFKVDYCSQLRDQGIDQDPYGIADCSKY
jgi:hypothetical protein